MSAAGAWWSSPAAVTRAWSTSPGTPGRLCGDEPLYALMGGFHLNGPLFEPLIPRVLDELATMDPAVLVPAHCTGWPAQHALAARFPSAFIPNAVGTSFYL